MIQKMRIAVLKGGPSAEREVSLRTGAAVAQALAAVGHEVTEVDVRGADFVLPAGCDIAFIALHGTFGEDGQVQAELERRKVVYTGCGVEASRKAFDKIETKKAFVVQGVPTPACEVLSAGRMPSLGVPYVVKPARQGSSVGISRVETPDAAAAAMREAEKYDEHILVEEMIVGKELTVGVLGDQVLPIVFIKPKEGYYDYRNKYTPEATRYECPADLPEATAQKVREAALKAHASVGCQVYSRVDVMLDEQGEPYVLEVNTIPGMTETSLLPKAAAAAGLSFAALCERIIELSLQLRAV
jgi:D-alanine-D-alanine ligase